ncbi:protein gamma response 1 [Aristolochia californica]|uniref:protein gamma response 1 n=1 Tax=Aristolochia californica TaxID=171875 RepID=UPI0035DED053
MEEDTDKSRHAGYTADNDDPKNVAQQSTILVATIQDIREKISEIELIFCSQLFPAFQIKSRNWHCLLHQVEELQFERQKAQEQIQHLTSSFEKEKLKLTENLQLLSKYEIENKQLVEMKTELDDLQKTLNLKAEEMGKEEKLRKQLGELVAFYEKENRKLKKENRRLSRHYNYVMGKVQRMEEEADSPKRLEPPENSAGNHCVYTSIENVERNMMSKGVKEDVQDLPVGNSSKAPKEEVVAIPVPALSEMDFGNSDDETQEIKLEGAPNHEKNFTSSGFASSSFHTKFPINEKSDSSAAVTKTDSSWRRTRYRHEPGGADPHDDFLDTPLENVKRDRMKAKDEVLDVSVQPPKEKPFLNYEDETWESNSNPAKQKQKASIPKLEKTGFKHVAPVRKKAERDNLIGVECKQCKKFYEAVLPDAGNENNRWGNNNQDMRCEHHIGVSRHRYRYIPPSTPEGFWNIGFDSDM